MNITAIDLFGLEGFGDKRLTICSARLKIQAYHARQILFALGIEGIGKKTAKDLVKRFRTLENLKNASLAELGAVDGIGEILANNIFTYFRDSNNADFVQNFLIAA